MRTDAQLQKDLTDELKRAAGKAGHGAAGVTGTTEAAVGKAAGVRAGRVVKRLFTNGGVVALLCMSGLSLACGSPKGDDKVPPPQGAKAGQNDEQKPRVLESVDLAPGKAITPQDQAKVSALALKVLGHVSKAQQDIQAKNVDAAKTELAQAGTLLDIIKEVLPTVKVIDHVWVTKTSLSYLNTTDIRQDLVTVSASIDQVYDILPEGKAKEHCKEAKQCLAKDKQPGAAKAKEEWDAVEEALDFREADVSVAYTARLVKEAQEDLQKGKTKEAGEALTAVSNGVLFFDTAVVDPMDVAARRIWMATQDYAAKDYKAAKTRMGMAKTALQGIATGSDKTPQAGVTALVTKIDGIDVTKAGEKTGAALDALWQDTRKLLDLPPVKAKK